MSIQALWTGATGMEAMQMKVDVIANNLANVNTTAFKRARANTENLFYQQIKLPGAQDAFNNYAPTGLAIGLGARVQGTQNIFSQGAFDQTNNPLDLAIDGDGFFQVIDPTSNNFLYTRAGNLSINSNGILVVGSSNTGRVVQPQISIPIDTTGIVISAEGNVSIQQFGQTQFSQVGQLQMAKFLNPQGLLGMGENMYQETLSSGAAIFGQPGTNGLGTIQQNMLERSNVEPVNELIDLITTQRSFELNSQSVQAGDQMLQLVNNLRRF
jgi:flagellar basal-body rod protein FlgG